MRRKNYDSFVERMKNDLKIGRQGAVVAIELDRKLDGNWNDSYSFDLLPSLRVKGPDFFVMSLEDLNRPSHDRRYHGWLPDTIRLLVLCHRVALAGCFESQRALRSATGNAQVVAMLACATVPLVTQAVDAGVCTNPVQRPLKRAALDVLASRLRDKRMRNDRIGVD